MEAINANGCIGRDTVDVAIVGTAPTVAFDIGTACAGNAVTFADATLPEGSSITGQEWLFPTGGAAGAVVENTFPATGDYPIALEVTLANGCTGIGRDTVTVNPLPLVSFNFDEVIPCAGNEVAFESLSGVPGNGSIASYNWSFGNGTTDTGLVGSTVFESLGANTAQLAVTTTAGCSDSLLSNVVVLGSPIADFDAAAVCLGQPTVFEENVDISQSGGVFYNWQFGDGFFSNFPNTSHVYAAPGLYDVTLRATGNDFGSAGCRDEITKQVLVYAPPTAALTVMDGCVGAPLLLTDISNAQVQGAVADAFTNRQWSATRDGVTTTIGSDSVQVWIPEFAGGYVINLDLTTAAGCTAGAVATAVAAEIPTAAFTLEVPTTTPPLAVATANSSTDATGFQWRVDGLQVSTDAAPELFIAEVGTYTIDLIATNGLGCTDTASRSLTVINPEVELGLVDVRYTIMPATAATGSRLALRALLSNGGNVPIRDFLVDVRLGLSANVVERMTFDLAAGEVKEFSLPINFEYLPARDLPYLCMSVSDPNGVGSAELNLDNNDKCIGLQKDEAIYIDPYPNPTSDKLNLGFVMPRATVLALEVTASDGRLIERFDLDLPEGYSLIEVSVRNLSKGIYFLNYGSGATKRFLVY